MVQVQDSHVDSPIQNLQLVLQSDYALQTGSSMTDTLKFHPKISLQPGIKMKQTFIDWIVYRCTLQIIISNDHAIVVHRNGEMKAK